MSRTLRVFLFLGNEQQQVSLLMFFHLKRHQVMMKQLMLFLLRRLQVKVSLRYPYQASYFQKKIDHNLVFWMKQPQHWILEDFCLVYIDGTYLQIPTLLYQLRKVKSFSFHLIEHNMLQYSNTPETLSNIQILLKAIFQVAELGFFLQVSSEF